MQKQINDSIFIKIEELLKIIEKNKKLLTKLKKDINNNKKRIDDFSFAMALIDLEYTVKKINKELINND
jgi:hypothetical protein